MAQIPHEFLVYWNHVTGGGRIILTYTGLLLVVFYLTFVYFLAVIKLRDSRDSGVLKNAPLIIRSFAYLTLAIGLVLDVTLNILLSVVLIEPPQEFLTTDRVKRLKNSGNDWQRACSRWLCGQLNNIDSKHCGD